MILNIPLKLVQEYHTCSTCKISSEESSYNLQETYTRGGAEKRPRKYWSKQLARRGSRSALDCETRRRMRAKELEKGQKKAGWSCLCTKKAWSRTQRQPCANELKEDQKKLVEATHTPRKRSVWQDSGSAQACSSSSSNRLRSKNDLDIPDRAASCEGKQIVAQSVKRDLVCRN